MSTIQEKINKVLGLFKTFAEQSAIDPSQLKISDKQVGGKVELINEDGSLSPVPDGEYKDADGVAFTVKDGLITEWDGQKEAPEAEKEAEMAEAPVEAPETPEEEKQEDQAMADLKAEVENLKAETEALKQAVADLKAAVEGDNAQEEAQMSAFSKKVDELTNAIKVIAKMPAEFSKTSQSNAVKDAKEANLMEFAKVMAGFKN